MFWKFNPSNPNHIDSLLNKEDVTLKELMDDEDILQECKAQNKNLLEFLGRPEIMEELVTLTTTEPSEEFDERSRFKYPNIACELLTCDVPSINERLAANTTLAKLYPFLESEPPLNPLLASFFSKTLGVLVARKTDQHWYSYQFTCLQVLEFLKSKEDSVSHFLKHLGTSAIMDLLLKLITQVEGADMRQNLVNWLESHSVVSSLVALLDPSVDNDRHCNASQLLCKIITKTRGNVLASSEPNPLINILKTVESPQTVDQILQCILSSKKNESSIVGGISVLLTLLGFKKRGSKNDSGSENGAGAGTITEINQEDYQEVIQSTAAAILPYLKDFHNLLLDPPPRAPVQTTVGTLDPPLGRTRWHVAKLFSALAATNSPAINQELAQLGTVEVLLDLFFKYQWNNFLHRQVERFLAYALNSTPVASGDGEPPYTVLIENILVQCRLIQRILDAWAENEDVTSKEGRRRGYMGHLIIIANNFTKQLQTEPIKTIVSEKIPQETQDAWEAFENGPLAEVNKVYESGLKPVPPTNDEEEAFRTVQFLTNATNQGYMTYQSPDESQTSSIDTFNFRDAERLYKSRLDIARLKDYIQPNDRLSDLCRDFSSNLAADGGDVSHWEDTVQLSEILNKSSKWSNDDISDSHNSDDELDEEPERGEEDDVENQYGGRGMVVHMEVDTDPWLKGPGAGVMDPLSDPWATSGDDGVPSAEDQSDWADFSKFEANFNLSTTLDDGDNASSNEAVSPFDQSAAPSVSAIMPNAEEAHSETLGKEIESDANANPTSPATIADVTPAAIAAIDAVAASAIAAVASVQAAAEDLDNRRFLPEPAPADTTVGDSEAISETEKETTETPEATEAPSETATPDAPSKSATPDAPSKSATPDAPSKSATPDAPSETATSEAPAPTSCDPSNSGGCADSSGSAGSANSAGSADSGSGACGNGGDSGGSGDCGSCE